MKTDKKFVTTSDQEIHLAWKEPDQRLLNEEFQWDMACTGPQLYFELLV